jgi:hypothetical protein
MNTTAFILTLIFLSPGPAIGNSPASAITQEHASQETCRAAERAILSGLASKGASVLYSGCNKK